MTDKTKKLEKLKELHSKMVERLDIIDDRLLADPRQDDRIDLRIRLRMLIADISLDISLLETQIAADDANQTSGRYPYNVLNTEEKKRLQRENSA